MKQRLFTMSGLTLRFVPILFVLGLASSSGSAHAFTLVISDRAYINGGTSGVLSPLADNIESAFNASVGSPTGIENFLGALGNANAGSSRSYLSPGVIPKSDVMVAFSGSLGVAVGTGASTTNYKPAANSLPSIAPGAKSGVTVGVSGKLLRLPLPFSVDPTRFMLTASFFSLDMSSWLKNGVSLKSMQVGLGGTYLLFPPINWVPVLRWNGFRVTGGLTYSTFDAKFSTPMNFSQTSGASTMTFNTNIDIGAKSWVLSLPLEATTGVRFFWFWNLFTGLGLDFNVGSSKIVAGGTGPVTATAAATTVFTGTANISGDSEGKAPSPVQLRYILGTQFDFGPFAIYAQGLISTPSVYAVNAGAKFTF